VSTAHASACTPDAGQQHVVFEDATRKLYFCSAISWSDISLTYSDHDFSTHPTSPCCTLLLSTVLIFPPESKDACKFYIQHRAVQLRRCLSVTLSVTSHAVVDRRADINYVPIIKQMNRCVCNCHTSGLFFYDSRAVTDSIPLFPPSQYCRHFWNSPWNSAGLFIWIIFNWLTSPVPKWRPC